MFLLQTNFLKVFLNRRTPLFSIIIFVDREVKSRSLRDAVKADIRNLLNDHSRSIAFGLLRRFLLSSLQRLPLPPCKGSTDSNSP